MNQLTKDTTPRISSSLCQLVQLYQARKDTYRVVAFMVTVKLMEKKLKSHVGNVIVVNVTSQIKKPGTIPSSNHKSLTNVARTP
jgi:dephospho-CoA kinase